MLGLVTPENRQLELGSYLRMVRQGLGLSLRAVEEKSAHAVTNGYLSQIENGSARRPSPAVLWSLAEVYGVDYGDLLLRAGIRVPSSTAAPAGTVPGFPLDAVADLTPTERDELLKYIAFLRSQRP